MKSWVSIVVVIGVAGVLAVGGCRPVESEGLWLELGGERFLVELAYTDAERDRGMAGRSSIGRNEGMLFVFKDEQERTFWMRGCLIPLDILFVDAGGNVVSYHESMEPPKPGASLNSLPRYPSGEPAQFAFEVKAGTIERLGVQVGDRVRLVDLPLSK